MAERHVTEGVSGLWHYHISEAGTNATALCGAKTMYTAIRLSDWGVPFGEHFPKKPTWCAQCAALADVTQEQRGKIDAEPV